MMVPAKPVVAPPTSSPNLQRQSCSPNANPYTFGWFCDEENQAITFRLYAPTAQSVELVLENKDMQQQILPMEADSLSEWYTLSRTDANVGDYYGFLIDGQLTVPDPASRYQPNDVHGLSQIVDSQAYEWHDQDWTGRPWDEAVVYELHVGTFTPQGTYRALMQKLDYLVELGVTAIELMPLADFPGPYNWGYDGVLPYAPDASYGHPDELKALIDMAHQKGLMVFLDVVYNHFGPEGNYLYCYAKSFFNQRKKNPWGDALRLDAKKGKHLREFFIENALYWLNDFHFDGLRLDAVHALDESVQIDFLDELAKRVQENGPSNRRVYLMLENDFNQSSLIGETGRPLPKKPAKPKYTAQWNDDSHHAFHAVLTGESDGYYSDYHANTSARSPLDHLGRCLTQGFSYQSEPSPFRRGEVRGEPTDAVSLLSFINFLQNHDQVGNRAMGERLNQLATPEAIRAGLILLLLSPSIPMLFMGEEWQSPSPFYFFCDLSPQLNPKITKGRRQEFAQFDAFAEANARQLIPDPCHPQTFEESKLDWFIYEQPHHQQWFSWTKTLLTSRHKDVVPLLKDLEHHIRGSYQVVDNQALAIRWFDTRNNEPVMMALANLSDTPLICRGHNAITCLGDVFDMDVEHQWSKLVQTHLDIDTASANPTSLGTAILASWSVHMWIRRSAPTHKGQT